MIIIILLLHYYIIYYHISYWTISITIFFYHLDKPFVALHSAPPGWWQKGSVCLDSYWLRCNDPASGWTGASPPPHVVPSRYCWPHHPAASWCLTLEEDRTTWTLWTREDPGICCFLCGFKSFQLSADPDCSVCRWISRDLVGSLCRRRGTWILLLPRWPPTAPPETPSEIPRCPVRGAARKTRYLSKYHVNH